MSALRITILFLIGVLLVGLGIGLTFATIQMKDTFGYYVDPSDRKYATYSQLLTFGAISFLGGLGLIALQLIFPRRID